MPSRGLCVVAMEPKDWSTVRTIYLEGMATGNPTLETSAPEWDNWDRSHLTPCRMVARRGKEVAGWAALSPVSGRRVYGGVAEVSVYVAASARGQGVGLALLSALLVASESAGIWTLQGSVFPENAGSLALCRRAGFGNARLTSGDPRRTSHRNQKLSSAIHLETVYRMAPSPL